jgi:hypothetical protein
MASVVHEGAGSDRRTTYRRAADHRTDRVSGTTVLRDTEGMRVSWGGVWGGVLVGMGMLLLLAALGVAIGVSAVDPAQPDAQALGTGAAIWAGISLLVALFVGGMVSTRIGAIFDKTTGLFEGVLVWVLSVLLMGYLATSGISMVAGGAFRLVGGATQAVSSVMMGGGSGSDLSSGSVDQIVQRLRDPKTASTLAAATGMPEDQVRTSLTQMADKAQAARDNPQQAATEVRQGVQNMFQQAKDNGTLQQAAQKVQEGASTTAWVTFGALVLGLIAAIFGAMSGRRRAAVQAGREV